LAWVFFRAESLGHAFDYLSGIFSSSLFSKPDIFTSKLSLLLGLVALFLLIEWLHRERQHGLQFIKGRVSQFGRWSLYYFILLLIAIFNGDGQEFIYFQF